MKRFTVTVALVASAVLCGCASRNLTVRTRQAIVDAQASLITANNAADIAAVEEMTADDWTNVSAAGVRTTKADLRAMIQNRGPAVIQASQEQLASRQKDWIVNIHGDVGIVTRLTAGDHGNRQWVTTVWALRENKWKRVFTQVTNAPSK